MVLGDRMLIRWNLHVRSLLLRTGDGINDSLDVYLNKRLSELLLRSCITILGGKSILY